MLLNLIINIYISLFNSKKLFFTLILSWILIILFTYFILPPATDDMFYFWPALNFFYESRIGMYEGDTFVATYFQFPTYSIINSFFLKIISFFEIQLTLFSYKLFNKILLIFLFILCFYWIKINTEKKSFYLKINTFLILITFTPFTLGLIGSARPEFLGIIFILLSLIIFTSEKIFFLKNIFKIILSSFFLGLAFTVHPQFFTIATATALVMVIELYFKSKNFKLIFIFSLFFTIPIVLLFYWYYLGYPSSLDFIFNRVDYIGENPIINVKNNLINLIKQSLFLTDSPIYTQIYQSIYTLPYLLLLIIIFPFIFFLFRNKKLLFYQRISFFIFISALFNFTFIKTYDFYNGVLALFLILFYCSLFSQNTFISNQYKPTKLYLMNLFCIFIFILNSFFIITHSTKFLFSKTQYFNHTNTKKGVNPHLNNDTILILTSEKLFSVFIKYFENNYIGNNSKKAYMLFPFPDAGPTKSQLQNAKYFLNSKFISLEKKNLIFGSKKIKSDLNKSKKEINLFLNNNLSIYVNYHEIIYEDKEHIFFIPEKIKIIN